MTQFKLYYFNLRGRAELARYIFKTAGVEFEDIRIERADWPKLKSETPFGQLPVLEVIENGQTTKISQSLAIARFLARKFNLAGNSDIEKGQVDMYSDQLADLLGEMVKSHFEKNENLKKDLQTKLQNETLPNNMKLFESKLTQTNTGFLIGNNLTWTDLFLYSLLEWLQGNKDALLAHFPKIKSHYEMIASIPNIAKHIATRPLTEI